jgi:hypothetical protein
LKLGKTASKKEKDKLHRANKMQATKSKREAAAKAKTEAKEAKKEAGKAPNLQTKTRAKRKPQKPSRSRRNSGDSEASPISDPILPICRRDRQKNVFRQGVVAPCGQTDRQI